MDHFDNRPKAADVWTRAAILKRVVITAMATPPRELVEQLPAAEREKFGRQAEAGRQKVVDSLGELKSALTPWERDFFAASSLTLSTRQHIDAMWRAESLQALIWALEFLAELPYCDTQASTTILNAFPASQSSSAAVLRSADVIDKARDVAELWHWRSRTRELIDRDSQLSHNPELARRGITSYNDIVRLAAAQAAADGVITAIDGDFGWRGKPYRNLSADEWSEARSIAVERHFALNWLCGYAPGMRWDETPTDT